MASAKDATLMPYGGRDHQTISKVEQWKQGGAGICLSVLDSQNIVLSNTTFCQNSEGVSLFVPMRTQLPKRHCLSWVIELLREIWLFHESLGFFSHLIESKFGSSTIWVDKSGGWLETLCLTFPQGGEAGSQFISSSLTISRVVTAWGKFSRVNKFVWAWNRPRHHSVPDSMLY